ncbi:MAG: hypothetical protein C0505_12730 [Leptothrix sp. (in: Bacteria)]|nr:hypothetical protein [Leptothrix sp. (in: b-proteobacteria)]
MGLLDNVIGAIGASTGGSAAGPADPLQAILALLGRGGGLGGLVQQMQKGGLGDTVASWISTGPNQPVSADALGQVLNNDAVAGFARQLGINPQDALGALAGMLPQVVDKLTPQGQLPQGDLASVLGGLGGLGGGGGAGGLGDLAGLLGGLLNKR